jgi:branched-chain amino acid transport system ATP-binding protein/branched-chain amino acid transport system permease protein
MRIADLKRSGLLVAAATARGMPVVPAWGRVTATLAGTAVVAALAPAVLGPYAMRVAVLSAIYFALALGYNVIITEAGQFHLGFIVYYALGAYTVAIATTHYGWDFWSALALSVPVVVVFTIALGFLLLRFRGDYLSVVSLAAAEILRLVFANWRQITGGYLGLPGVPPPMVLGRALTDQRYYWYLAVLLAVAGVLAISFIKRSGAGLVWRGIRQNERALRSVGIRVDAYKQLSFLVGGLLAGIAGAIYASYQTIVDPSLATLDGTILVLTMVILGGGSVVGLLLGATLLTMLPELMRVFAEYRMLLLGVIFVVVMNWRPEGFSRRATLDFHAQDAGTASAPARVTRPVAHTGSSLALAVASDALLAAEHVTVRFGGLVALYDVSVAVPQGAVLGLIGPNGAGKTTLFNVIAGMLRPNAGKVRYQDRRITQSPEVRSRMGIARTFQTLEFCPGLTCLENVMLARLPRTAGLGRLAAAAPGEGLRAREVSRALAALELTGIRARADELAGALPYGDRRRLEIARALAGDPTLLLLDEPAAGMNPSEVKSMAGLIQSIHRMGITIFLIEHNVRMVREVCDRVIVLSTGQIIAEGHPEAVVQDPAVIEAYLGKRYRGTA